MPKISAFWNTIGRNGHVWLPDNTSEPNKLKIIDHQPVCGWNPRGFLFTDTFRPLVTIRKNREVVQSFISELVREYGIVGKVASARLHFDPKAEIIPPLTPRKIEEIQKAISYLRANQRANREMAARVGCLLPSEHSGYINCHSLLKREVFRRGIDMPDERLQVKLSFHVMKDIVRFGIVIQGKEPVDIFRVDPEDAIRIAMRGIALFIEGISSERTLIGFRG